ncbi:MAG: 6-phosphogluconolactonase [Acidobacteria bacterium]|nr:6-phosphogluconolactonase [Acidobacteriota bacterium]
MERGTWNVERQLVVCDNLEDLGRRTAELFVTLATKAVTSHGRFSVALSGGETPRALHSQLQSDAYVARVPWSEVYVFWGDERYVPHDHPDSNYGMARATMLDQVPIPDENIFPVPTGKGDAESAAGQYQETLRSFFNLDQGEQPQFDLIVLGMGEDGHTASLFPDTAALENSSEVVVANYLEKLDAHRVTLTIPAINQATFVVFLIAGASKASALKEVLEGPYQPNRFPSQFVQPTNGKLLFLVEFEAARELAATGER